MTRMNDDRQAHITKDIARKIVVNISDSDLESDQESLDDDIYCPSWLKPNKASHLFSSNTDTTDLCLNEQQNILNTTTKTNKINLDVGSLSGFQKPQKSIGTSETQNKNIDSRIHSSFFAQPNLLNQFQKILIELIETEIEYFKNLYLCQSVYSSLLLNVAEYKNIFTKQEKSLLFLDVTLLTEISKSFIKSLVDNLILSNGFSNARSLDEFKVEDEDKNVFNYNTRQLVINSNTHKLDIGTNIHKLFKASNFKPTILAFFAKHNFRMKILNGKVAYGGPSVDKWLKETNFLTKYKSKSWSLETILIQPLQRIMKYPLLLKQLIDNSIVLGSDVQKHELNLALIRINLIIDECNKQDSLASFEEMEKKSMQILKGKQQQEAIYDVNLEKRIPVENEIILDIATHDNASSKDKSWFLIKDFLFTPKERLPPKREGQYACLVASFRDKYYQIRNIRTTYELFSRLLIEFMRQQSKYARLWKHFFQGIDTTQEGPANYIDSIYSSYVDKMEIQSLVTQLLVEEINTRIISAIILVLSYCDDIKIQIQLHRKLRSSYITYIRECEQNKHKPNIFQKTHSKAQTCINIENQLKDKLPQLLQYLSIFVNLLQNHSNILYLDWLKQQIGERSVHEFKQLRMSLSNKDTRNTHADIVQFYHNNMQLTKFALEQCHQGLDHFRHFTTT